LSIFLARIKNFFISHEKINGNMKKTENPRATLYADVIAQADSSSFLEAAPDAMVIVGPDGRICFVNGQAEKLFGYQRSELMGHLIEALVPPRFREKHPDHRNTYFAEPHPRPMGAGLDLFALRKDGSEFPAEISLAPVKTARGMLVTAAIRDVTDRKRAEEALENANRELEAFSYSVAHDLRAPLRGIDGFSQILLENYSDKLDKEGRHYLAKLSQSAHHMAQLIDSLLMLSRVTRADILRERIDLSEIVRTTAAQLRESAPQRKVEFVIDDSLFAHGDRRLLGILFDNLLGNAFKFTAIQPKARIEFGSVLKDGRNVFFIRDNGAGFDMAYASKLFGVFQRLHAEREFEGIGIGLATVQRIIRRHGGDIWAQGEVNKGATFYFVFEKGGAFK
jgi:PAS domain S-box-containing protein